jgi:hypothetical protein
MKKQSFAEAVAEIKERVAQKQLEREGQRRRKQRRTVYKYTPTLISYLDLLGMKDLLDEAGTDADQVAQVLQRFRDFSAPMEDQKKLWKSAFVNFSDLGLRILPILTDANVKYRLGCFFHEVMDLGFIQVNLVNRGILVRGGLTLGYLCHKKGLVFGPGLVEAHHMESKVAQSPRIIVSDTAMQALEEAPVLRGEGNSFKEEMSYLKNFLRKDEDGVWFLDYLAIIRSEKDSDKQYAMFLERHKALIEKQRSEIRALPRGAYRRSRLAKLKWLIQLHRRHISELDPQIFFEHTGVRLRTLRVRER